MFCMSMLAGFLIQKCFDGIKLGGYIDKHVMNRIGSWVTDYLVAFGVASIQVSVVVKYATPMALLFTFGVVYCVSILFLVGRKVFHNFWFERSIFVYGWNTGVVAMGVTLLRIVDPEFKTKTLEDYGMAYVVLSFAEIAIVSILPGLVMSGIILGPGIVLTCLAIAAIICSKYLVGWFNVPGDQLREGEKEVIDEFMGDYAVELNAMQEAERRNG